MKTLKALKIVVLVLVAAGFVFAPFVYAFEKENMDIGKCPTKKGWRESYMHKMGKKHHFIEKLGLSEEQQEQLLEQRRQHHAGAKELMEQLKEKTQALHQELDKLEPDQKTLKRTAAQIKKIKGDLLDLRIDSILATKKILTLQQYQKMQEMRKEHMKKPKGFGERIRDWWQKRGKRR